jgi:16S rRNA C1402 (ribose-2'-O) methylase RsmI
VTAALSIAGLTSTPFTFLGFLAVKGRERTNQLQMMTSLPHTVVFFEAPHRIVKTLADLLPGLQDRPIVCCRELTKLHEEVRRGSVAAMLEHYRAQESDVSAGSRVRGEFTVVVGPRGSAGETQTTRWSHMRDQLDNFTESDGEEHVDSVTVNDTGSDPASPSSLSPPLSQSQELQQLLSSLRQQGLPRSQAVRTAVATLNMPKSIVYAFALKMKW